MIQLNPNLSFGPSFIVGSLTVSDEILNIKIDVFFHIVEENDFKTMQCLRKFHSPSRSENETFCYHYISFRNC
jgi:hypothetical protein